MDDNVYAAERIIAKRKIKGVTEYRIAWKGYPPSANTWEPYDNILDKALIHEFENKKQSIKSKKLAKENKRRASKKEEEKKEEELQLELELEDPDGQDGNVTMQTDEHMTIEPESGDIERQDQNGQANDQDIARSPQISADIVANETAESNNSNKSKPQDDYNDETSRADSNDKLGASSSGQLMVADNHSPDLVKVTPIGRSSPAINTASNKTDFQLDDNQNQNQTKQQQPPQQQLQPSVPTRLLQHNLVNNSSNFSKNRRGASKFAIMNTIVTDVTVNDQTITISESKSPQCFFRDVERNSIAVDTTHFGDNQQINKAS